MKEECSRGQGPVRTGCGWRGVDSESREESVLGQRGQIKQGFETSSGQTLRKVLEGFSRAVTSSGLNVRPFTLDLSEE